MKMSKSRFYYEVCSWNPPLATIMKEGASRRAGQTCSEDQPTPCKPRRPAFTAQCLCWIGFAGRVASVMYEVQATLHPSETTLWSLALPPEAQQRHSIQMHNKMLSIMWSIKTSQASMAFNSSLNQSMESTLQTRSAPPHLNFILSAVLSEEHNAGLLEAWQ